jgi:hypothetical protein
LILNQDCFAKWLSLWGPCQDSSAFDIVQRVPPSGYCTSALSSCTFQSPNFVVISYRLQQITQHNDVCRPAYVVDGRCPRAIIGVLGSLLVEKLTFGAFVGPCIALLLTTSQCHRARVWFMRTVLCKPEDYEITKSLDCEMASVVMLLEIPLALGFCVPALVPLACVALGAHAAVFNQSSLALTDHARPSAGYLCVSLFFGWALVAWVYHESDLHGAWEEGREGKGSGVRARIVVEA